jgi:MFS family permease
MSSIATSWTKSADFTHKIIAFCLRCPDGRQIEIRRYPMAVTEAVPEKMARAGRKITIILFVVQSLISAGAIATSTVLSILGEQLSGTAAWAGVPSATIQLAAAPFAYVWGVVWDRIGRRNGLTLGLGLGVVGMIVGLTAIETGSMWFFLLGLVGLGAARAAMQLARFIAAEVNPPLSRGRAISYVMLAGTVGAVGGPLLVAPSGRWAVAAGLPEIAGQFAVSVVLFGVAVAVTWLGLRPEPMTVAQEVAALFPERENPTGAARKLGTLVRLPGVFAGVTAMALPWLVMNMVLDVTSLYMRDHEHPLENISIVLSAHWLGMFAFSTFSGKLADSWGRGPTILAGTGLMIASLVVTPVSSAVVPLGVTLFLLGLGWNLCFVGGSALLADHLTPKERSRTQGFNDLLIGLVSAVGSLGSGVLFASMGFVMVNLVGAAVVLVLLTVTVWWRLRVGARVQGWQSAAEPSTK